MRPLINVCSEHTATSKLLSCGGFPNEIDILKPLMRCPVHCATTILHTWMDLIKSVDIIRQPLISWWTQILELPRIQINIRTLGNVRFKYCIGSALPEKSDRQSRVPPVPELDKKLIDKLLHLNDSVSVCLSWPTRFG